MSINRRANGRRALPEVDSGSCNDRRSLPRRPGLGSHSSALSAKLVTAPVLEAVAAFTGHPVRSVPAGPAPRKGERGGGGHGAVGQTQLFTIHFDTRLAQYTVHDRGPRPVPLSGPPAWQFRPAGSLPMPCRFPSDGLSAGTARPARLPCHRGPPVQGSSCPGPHLFQARSVRGPIRSWTIPFPGESGPGTNLSFPDPLSGRSMFRATLFPPGPICRARSSCRAGRQHSELVIVIASRSQHRPRPHSRGASPCPIPPSSSWSSMN